MPKTDEKSKAEGKKPTPTSAEKVQKQKVLESVPHKIFDAKTKGKGDNPTTIRNASKHAALEDTTPLYKPNLRKAKPVDVPVQQLKETLGVYQSEAGLEAKGKKRVVEVKRQASVQHMKMEKKTAALPSPKLKEMMGKPPVADHPKGKVTVVTAKSKPIAKSPESLAHRPPGKKDVEKLAKGDEKKNPAPRSHIRFSMSGRFGKNPKDVKSAGDGAGKGGMNKLLKTQRIAAKVLKILRARVHEGGDVNQLKLFGIPDQRQLLTMALTTDSCRYDFGGNLRHYYSDVLKNYIPFNMLERYRGAPLTSPCLTAVDVTSLGTKAGFQLREKEKRRAARDLQLNALHEASMDETHFEFLKQLSDNQPVSLPLSMIHDIVVEVLPVINKMQAFYNGKLGPTHECTEQSTESFIRMLNRTIMYNAM